MFDKKIFKHILGLEELPTIPLILYRILEEIEGPLSSAKSIGQAISYDQSSTAKVLKLANSAYYSLPRRVDSLSTAIVFLGLREIKALVMSVGVFDFFFQKKSEAVFSREHLWLHSIGTATAARLVARHTGYPNLEGAFLAGLLHDIGKVVLDNYLKKEYKRAIDSCPSQDVPLCQLESQALETNHAEIGGWLIDRWNFPPSLVDPVTYHHELPPPNSLHQELIAIVHLADILCQAEGIGFSGNNCLPPVNDTVWKTLKLSPQGMEALGGQLRQEKGRIEAFLAATR